MNFGKSLRSMFVEDDAPSTDAATPAGPHATAPVISNQPIIAAPSKADQQALDDKLQKLLIDAVEAAGIDGYKAFDDILDSLEDVIPDVNARYKKAMEILGKQGHDPVSLLNDIDKAIGALETESRTFEQNQKSQFQASVGALTKSVETTTQQITVKQQQADTLLKEVADLKQKRVTDQATIATEQSKIDNVQSRFGIVYRVLMSDIQNQRSIVATKVQGTP